MFILVVTEGARKGESIRLREGKPVLVGRQPASSFSVPSDAMMSGKHFTAMGAGPTCVIKDEGSSNGTYVDGVRIVEQAVTPGQRIRAGKSEFLVTYTPSFGNWLIPAIPPGWAEVPGRGIQVAQPGRFPTVILFVEEEEPLEIPLDEYIARQQIIAREHIPNPRFHPPVPVQVPNVNEAVTLHAEYVGTSGMVAKQRQLYVVKGGIVGVISMTTIEPELPHVERLFDAVVAKAEFDPEIPATAEAQAS
jgi:hypothetical protein